MNVYKLTLRPWFSCRTAKQQSGLILLWMLFLLLIISSSSLALAKYSVAQQVLVQFYDLQYQTQRQIRNIDRSLLTFLNDLNTTHEYCLNSSFQPFQCIALPLDSDWQIYGRLLPNSIRLEDQTGDNAEFNFDQGLGVQEMPTAIFELRTKPDDKVLVTFVYQQSSRSDLIASSMLGAWDRSLLWRHF